jgi:hypothetical protein
MVGAETKNPAIGRMVPATSTLMFNPPTSGSGVIAKRNNLKKSKNSRHAHDKNRPNGH